MKPKLSTRKPIERITIKDLQVFPIWEFALDEEGRPGQDETWIRPVRVATVPERAYSQIVSASFFAKSVDNLTGFMIVTTAERPIELSPGAIVTDHGYHFIPSNRTALWRREREKFSEALGISFPLTFELRVSITGEKNLRVGIIE